MIRNVRLCSQITRNSCGLSKSFSFKTIVWSCGMDMCVCVCFFGRVLHSRWLLTFKFVIFFNWLIYALVSRSNSNLACDSLSCLNFFSCTVASVRKHVADAISATTPTAAKMNDQPGMWEKRKLVLFQFCVIRNVFTEEIVGMFRHPFIFISPNREHNDRKCATDSAAESQIADALQM